MVTVREVVQQAQQAYNPSGKIRFADCGGGPHEAEWLALETARAQVDLGYHPKWSMAETVTRAMAWYRSYQAGADARELCLAEIADYG